jgi:hypothetical protein
VWGSWSGTTADKANALTSGDKTIYEKLTLKSDIWKNSNDKLIIWTGYILSQMVKHVFAQVEIHQGRSICIS